MIARRTKFAPVALLGCFAAAAVWLSLAGGRAAPADQPAAPGGKAAAIEERPADKDAVEKAIASFVAAFQKGDAKAVSALWTAEGEYVSDDGTTIRGHAALEKDYADFFAKNPGNGLEVEIETIRFPSR